MEIEPFQKPHPPLWYGAHSPDSAERAARKGLHMVTNDMPAPTRAIIERYRQTWREVHGARRAAQNGDGAVHRGGRQRRQGDGDRAAGLSALAVELHAICIETHGTAPESPLNVDSFDTLIGQGQGIAGSPDTVREFLARADRGQRHQLRGGAVLLRRSQPR